MAQLADLQIGAEDVGQLGGDAEPDGDAAEPGGHIIVVGFDHVGGRCRPRDAAAAPEGLFARPLRRTAKILIVKHARAVKRAVRVERERETSSQPFLSLADAWGDQHGLRAGDFIDRPTALSTSERKRLAKERQLHPNIF